MLLLIHVLYYREYILDQDPADVERVMSRIRRLGTNTWRTPLYLACLITSDGAWISASKTAVSRPRQGPPKLGSLPEVRNGSKT